MLFPLLLEIRWFWRLFRSLCRGAAWVVGSIWEGASAIARTLIAVGRFPRALAERLPCPRGHRSPVYGVYRCTCGALHEGWAFDRCRICGHTAGWTPCITCGLPIKNPFPE